MERAARWIAGLAVFAVIALSAWPLAFGPQPLPAWAAAPDAARLALLLCAAAVWLATTLDDVLARRVAFAAGVYGAAILLTWLVTLAAGTPLAAPDGSAKAALIKLLAARPGVLLASGVAALGASLWWRDPDSGSFDASALLACVAACAFGLLAAGHLFGAETLVAGGGRLAAQSDSPLGVALLFALSLAALGLHPGGPLAAYEGDEPGAVARRRLLPAAVLIPVASGFLLLWALTGRQLSPTLAVALTVFVNVLAMLFLLHRAGQTVTRVVWDRQKRMEAREAQARRQGMRDALTQLLNRRGWDAEVAAGEKQCRTGGLDACVLVIDLDGLKQVNDSEGHKAGDAYIQRAAHALRRAARRGDALARVGGDEFAYLVVDCDEPTARAVVQRFEEMLRAGKVSASVGYAMRKARSIEAAFDEADRAMYEQKRARKLRRA